MSDNTTLNTGSTGDVIRDVDKSGIKTQVVMIDVGGTGTESLFTGDVTGQALVGDSPPSVYLDGDYQPLSLTQQGRLRVSSERSNAMTDFWSDPFKQELTFGAHEEFINSPELDFWA